MARKPIPFIKICVACGEHFDRRDRHPSGGYVKTCSEECSAAHKAAKRIRDYRENPERELATIAKYQSRPEIRAKRNARKKAQWAANPESMRVRARLRRAASIDAARAYDAAWKRSYRAKLKAAKNAAPS